MSYRPTQRELPVQVLTEAGWLTGCLHAPPTRRLIDFLNQGKDHLNLSNVRLPGRNMLLPFFAVRTGACHAVATLTEEQVSASTNDLIQTAAHEVMFMLGSGTVRGHVQVAVGLRLSDWLVRQHHFVVVHGAVLHLAGDQERQTYPELLVRAERIIGFTETEAGVQPTA